jgi:hypothetical protein
MATLGATIIGMWQGFAILRRVKRAVQGWRGGKIKTIDLDAVRRHLT